MAHNGSQGQPEAELLLATLSPSVTVCSFFGFSGANFNLGSYHMLQVLEKEIHIIVL